MRPGSAVVMASASSYASSIVCGAIVARVCARSQGQPLVRIAQLRAQPQQGLDLRGRRAHGAASSAARSICSMPAVAPQITRPSKCKSFKVISTPRSTRRVER